MQVLRERLFDQVSKEVAMDDGGAGPSVPRLVSALV